MKLATFDIFDTALLRRCGEAENVFYLTACRLFPQDEALRHDFCRWRGRAEREAVGKTGHDVTLYDIYRYGGADQYEAWHSIDDMVAVECSVESDNLVANPPIRERIAKLRREGWTVAFVSDMYLDSRFLRSVLEREGCIEVGERVYVSCEVNKRKSTGLLFGHVRSELRPDEWIHHGDHRHSDVKMARKNGVKALWVDSLPTMSERALVAKSRALDSEVYRLSLLAGWQRCARVVAGGDTPSAEIAADYVVPLYVSYVSYVLERARRDGLGRLYFLSRDSWILYELARLMQPAYPEIELRYLFVSRKALVWPYLGAEVGREDYLAVQQKAGTVMRSKVVKLLADLQLTPESLRQDFGVSFGYDRIGSRAEEKDFLDKLFEPGTAVNEHLRRRGKEEEQLAMKYFEQEGLTDGVPTGLVDIGWLGTTRLMINRMLQRHGHRPVTFYYMGIRADVLPMRVGRYDSYTQVGQLSTELTAMVEHYMSASPYESTMGYAAMANGRVAPTFKNAADGRVANGIAEMNCKVASEVVRLMAGSGVDMREVLWTWMRHAVEDITTLQRPLRIDAFFEVGNFDWVPFVKRLSIVEGFKVVCLGGYVTGFDRASVLATYGRACFGTLWKIHESMSRVRSAVARRISSVRK